MVDVSGVPWYATERYQLNTIMVSSKGKVKVEGNTVWVDFDASVSFQHPGGERPPAYLTVTDDVNIREFYWRPTGWKYKTSEVHYENERTMVISAGDPPLTFRGGGKSSWKPSSVERKDRFRRLLIVGNSSEGLLWLEPAGTPRWTPPDEGGANGELVDAPPAPYGGFIETEDPGAAGSSAGGMGSTTKIILLIAVVLIAFGGGYAARGLMIRRLLGLGGA
jgi:hypothetical protein